MADWAQMKTSRPVSSPLWLDSSALPALLRGDAFGVSAPARSISSFSRSTEVNISSTQVGSSDQNKPIRSN